MSEYEPQRPDADNALASLRGARPSEAVSRRIAERALARSKSRAHRWRIPLALAAATATAVAAVWLVTPDAPPDDRLEVGRHTVVRAPGSDVEVVRRNADRTLVRLGRGAAEFMILPLGEGQSFRVRTPELEVEVVGTAFAVETADGCSTVNVTEGKVRVTAGRASTLLGAGESTRHCATAVEAPAPGEALIRDAQGLLLQPGRAGEAAALLTRYMQQHPEGVFVEEAMFHMPFAERMAGDEDVARRAAARFLESFPDSRRAARIRDAFPDGP